MGQHVAVTLGIVDSEFLGPIHGILDQQHARIAAFPLQIDGPISKYRTSIAQQLGAHVRDRRGSRWPLLAEKDED